MSRYSERIIECEAKLRRVANYEGYSVVRIPVAISSCLGIIPLTTVTSGDREKHIDNTKPVGNERMSTRHLRKSSCFL